MFVEYMSLLSLTSQIKLKNNLAFLNLVSETILHNPYQYTKVYVLHWNS